MITRRDLRFVGVFCLGLWMLALPACNSGDRSPSTANPPAEPTQEASPGGVQAEEVLGRGTGDYFGYAVAMSGAYALVGQPHDERRGTAVGTAVIYERQGDTWQEVSTLMADDATTDALFGVTVALDGHIAAVGAPGAHDGKGAVYVFERQNGVWRDVQRLTVSQPDRHDDFAMAIALSGPYLFAGAPGDSETGDEAGAVYVFERRGGLWSVNEVQKLLASRAVPGAQWGRSVAMEGAVALVGAPRHDGAGAAYVLELQDGVWTKATSLQVRERQAGDDFGRAVAIAGNVAVVGAPHHGRNGAVYLFEHQAGGWPSTAAEPLTASDHTPSARFGAAVAIAGRAILVGAYNDGDAEHRDSSGAAYLFTGQPGATWQERHKFPQADTQRSPHFGYAVAFTGPYILIGAPAILAGGHGHVYPYKDLLAALPPSAEVPPVAPPVVEDLPDDMAEPNVNRAPLITSIPITQAEMLHVTPEIAVTDAHLSQHTTTLNGQPLTPGTTITAAGSYELTVEATDAAGNTSRTTVRFSIAPSASP